MFFFGFTYNILSLLLRILIINLCDTVKFYINMDATGIAADWTKHKKNKISNLDVNMLGLL